MVPSRNPPESDLARLSRSMPIDRETIVYALVTLLASTVWLWPHIARFRDVPDRGDPVFSAWRLARFAHQLLNEPHRLFDGNIFHPLPLTLTYSDPTVLQGLLAAPLVASGADPLVVANLLFFVAFPACGAAFFFAAWRLTGDPRSALIAGLLGAWYPFHGEHYSHLELQWFMFVPLSFVALLLMLARPTATRGAAFGLAIAGQWLASMYFGLMLFSALVPGAVILAVAWRVRPSARLVRACGAAALIVLPAVLLTALPYYGSLETRGERKALEVAEGSAVPSDYLNPHRRMVSHQWKSRADNTPERELFPGFSPVILAAVGLSSGAGASQVALAGSAAIAFEWSLGFNGLTYPTLYTMLAPYRGLRVPARFAAIVGSLLILLGAPGTRRLLHAFRPGRPRNAACAILAALVLLDLRLATPLVKYWPTVPGIYSSITPDMVLAEFPRSNAIDYMYFSTRHWAGLLGGYSGFIPADPDLEESFEAFPSRAAIEALRRKGATHVTYNCAFERSAARCATNLDRLDSNPSLELVARHQWSGAAVSLYRLR